MLFMQWYLDIPSEAVPEASQSRIEQLYSLDMDREYLISL